MKTRAIILAGGEGSRLGILTSKRTKPAVPFAGKYRIIDFALSNCVNSEIFDVMIIAQYRPHSLIEHIGAGGPWDLDRDFTGGLRIFTPYKTRHRNEWFLGTADAVQQNISFLKKGLPDLCLLLSADHIYAMDYEPMITFHQDHQADVTLATQRVPIQEASRFGIVEINEEYRITSYFEKPPQPKSDLVNMGVYLFNPKVLDTAITDDRKNPDSTHDFGKDIIPALIKQSARIYAYPYSGYWVDVGTVKSYWQAHMDLLNSPPSIDLNNRSWVIHTRTEERGPVRLCQGAQVEDSLLSDGCVIGSGAKVIRSVLSPGVIIEPGAVIEESIILTDAVIGSHAHVKKAILDKRVNIGENAQVGLSPTGSVDLFVTVGKNSVIPAGMILQPGATIGTEVSLADFPEGIVKSDDFIQNRSVENDL
jgi:glucose-1-phosphate adenylyltransferase